MIYDKSDFRQGGQDRFRCGPKSHPDVHATTHYLEIRDGRRIVSSETLDHEGTRLAASLTTLELEPNGKKTRLRSTKQVVSFADDETIKNHEAGTNASLDNLAPLFGRRRRLNGSLPVFQPLGERPERHEDGTAEHYRNL